MAKLKSAVLIPSFGRPTTLKKCLSGLLSQSVPADQIFVIWQASDFATRDAASEFIERFCGRLIVVHSEEAGVVPAENAGLSRSTSDIILLLDDDAIAGPDWIAKHVRFYEDDSVGAVGGPAKNFHPDGRPFKTRDNEPVGHLTWYGKLTGNMYDHPDEWSLREPIQVDHLVGYNMSFRRCAIDCFETGLRRYWQLFELDVCLTVRDAGYRVMFDFGNVVEHHPTNATYAGGRDGDLQVKIYNGAYNKAFVLAKHTRGVMPYFMTIANLTVKGTVATPGLIAFFVAVARYGNWIREMRILFGSVSASIGGWRAGRTLRHLSNNHLRKG